MKIRNAKPETLSKAILIAALSTLPLLCAGANAAATPVAASTGSRPALVNGFTPAQTGTAAIDPTQAQAAKNYAKLPIAFEVNQGQTDAKVQFLARGQGYGLFLAPGEAVLSLRKKTAADLGAEAAASKSKNSKQAKAAAQRANDAQAEATITAVSMRFAGANTNAAATALNPLPGVSNYFMGSDAKQWHTQVQQYAKVRYAGVYPGIDAVYYGNQQQLEYDFIVAPGADPAAIKLDFNGVDKVSVDAQGNLVLAAAGGEVIQHKPVIYQMIAGQRKIVDGGYMVKGTRATFHVADYDKTKELTIDPILAYSSYLGNQYGNAAYAIALDASGNMYLAGTADSGYLVTPGAYQTSKNLGTTSIASDAFITKLSADGSHVIYSTFLGGTGTDTIFRIAVNAQGQAVVAGFTASSNFPTTSGAFQRTFGGTTGNYSFFQIGDGFVSKLSADGSSLVFSTFLGGYSDDPAFGLALDAGGNVYVAGGTTSSDFPTTPGSYQPTPGQLSTGSASEKTNAYVVKLNPDGSQLLYSTFIGVDNAQVAYNLTVDATGSAYVVGYTTSSHFPTTPGALKKTYTGGAYGCNAFVLKLNPAGSALIYSTLLGDTSDVANSIALDAFGNAYVAGGTNSAHFPTTPGAFQTAHTNAPINSAFLSKLNSSGTALIYSTYYHGTTPSYADSGSGPSTANPAGSNTVLVDADGNAYLVGSAGNVGDPHLPVTPDAFQSTYTGGGKQGFVAEFNQSGSSLIYSSYFGANASVLLWGAALTPTGVLYIAGGTGSTDLPTTPNAYQPHSTGTISGYGSSNFVALFAFPAATGLGNYSAVSRKKHGNAGTFDLLLNQAATVDSNILTVEPRSAEAGNVQRLVFTFALPITSVGGVQLGGKAGSALSTGTAAAPVISGNTVTVPITGVADRKRLQVTLTNINGSGVNATATIGYLIGDVTRDRQVTGIDAVATAAGSPSPATATNFAFNVSLSGTITALDKALVSASSPKAIE